MPMIRDIASRSDTVMSIFTNAPERVYITASSTVTPRTNSRRNTYFAVTTVFRDQGMVSA